ncbi:MAG: conjugal transfer protein TraX [Oscillospiraceae bacterium]|nr:conjugal transfer protein TraX [Oscillospiraceae bacterium]
MTSFALKIIAIIAMTIDHAGLLLFDDNIYMRIIGRLTMPIMAYFAAEGVRHTRNISRYMMRLLVFALISSSPVLLLFFGYNLGSFMVFNVIYTILFGVVGLHLYERYRDKHYKILMLILPAMAAFALKTDWSFAGVIFIYAFYFAGKDRTKTAVYFTAAAIINPAIHTALYLTERISYGKFVFHAPVQLGVLAALPLIFLHNGRQGVRAKYLFYIFYPLHMLVLWLISEFV